ncbi:hypothetical protein [Acidiphilium cryptum]|uniref:Glycosyltransferase RgtA/B/C/D-like domain-containing protein n=1 Tax=Acidiphilium cryptum (strain JF-5) TaxID=349163 RepID=A5G1K6_ACICJ|nr:hypothetical protein [Acidiphilium cryptum]ABQ31738.1 hypothetical protein Acry_2547 [Acidiphilium cryptum JF-5]
MKAAGRLQDRRATLSAATCTALALVAAAITILASARTIPAVLHGTLFDPDSYMRLVRIRQGFAAGHLVNIVLGDDSGHPLVVEWSRLFDAVIVALAAPLAPFIGWTRALFAAGVATGPLSAGLLAVGLAFAASPLTGGRWIWAPAIIAPLLPGIRSFNVVGIVHYHIAQVALTAIAIGCTLRAGAGDRRMAWAAGLWGGLAIWMMPETMPFVVLGFGALGYLWLFRRLGFILVRIGAGFAATLWFALWIDPPHGGMLTPEIDRLSIVYAMLGLAIATSCVGLAWLDRYAPETRRASLGLIGATCVFAVWLAAYPEVALGPYGLIPAKAMHIFFGSINEDQPTDTLALAASRLGPALLGLGYILHRFWRCRHLPAFAGIWLIAAVGLTLAAGLTARMMIFQQYPAAFAAGLAPVALHDISARFASTPRRAATLRLGLVWLPVVLAYVPALALAAGRSATPGNQERCSLRAASALLAPATGRIVLTDPSLVPELLYRTRVIGVGSLYHHGLRAFMRDWKAWRTPAGVAEPAAVRSTGAAFVLFCRADGAHSALGHGAAADALWPLLTSGQTPSWLQPLGHAGGYRLYRIRISAR